MTDNLHSCCITAFPKRSASYMVMELTEDEYEYIKTQAEQLLDLQFFVDYYSIVEDNFVEAYECIMKTLRTVLSPSEVNFTELNRRFMNLLNSFYAWLEHYEKRAKAWNVYPAFQAAKQRRFSTDLGYRLLYNLRVYSTHSARLPITRATTDLIREETSIVIDPLLILKNGDAKKPWSSNAQKDFRQLGEGGHQINIAELIPQMKTSFENAQKDFFNPFVSASTESFSFLDSIIPDDAYHRKVNCWLCDKSGEAVTNLTASLILPIKKVRDEYRIKPLQSN